MNWNKLIERKKRELNLPMESNNNCNGLTLSKLVQHLVRVEMFGLQTSHAVVRMLLKPVLPSLATGVKFT